jgi:hypothetical protein
VTGKPHPFEEAYRSELERRVRAEAELHHHRLAEIRRQNSFLTSTASFAGILGAILSAITKEKP